MPQFLPTEGVVMTNGLAQSALIATACLVFLALPAAAQAQRGVIDGTVRDTTGAILPGVVVQLTSAMTSSREVSSVYTLA